MALVADAVTYCWSALWLTRIRPVEPAPARPVKGHFTAGIRWVFAQPVMRALFAASATVQFCNFAFHTIFVLYATRELGLSPGLLGLVLSAGAIGGLLGAAATSRIVVRVGVGPAIVAGFALFSVPLVLVPLARGGEPFVVALLFTAEFVSCAGAMLVDITSGSLQMALIPDALRSRVTGAFRTLNHGFRPLGALAGGVLGSALGLRPTLWIATVGGTFCVLWVIRSAVSRTRALPVAAEEGERPEVAGAKEAPVSAAVVSADGATAGNGSELGKR
ncbi:MFS transporter [Streptomyces sp. NPDC049954]|uniref:MFS transporter n=1 Tax=Streptomyces sp. NPDC049954 TaxID=3155779 RepID=UPI0034208396